MYPQRHGNVDQTDKAHKLSVLTEIYALSQFSASEELRTSPSCETLDSDIRTAPVSEAKRRRKIHNPKQQQPLTPLPPRIGKTASSMSKPDRVYAVSHQTEMFSSDSSDYRALRRSYLLLEEDSFALERELKEVEDEVKALEDEKVELLDKLVVMEGLV
ncbi:unnamed protein product [Brassica oleracea var. botrytis]